jgi:type III secretion protein N (ATPase)
LLVKIGEYKRGSDTVADEAIDKIDSIRSFLKQGTRERSDLPTTIRALCELTGRPLPAGL